MSCVVVMVVMAVTSQVNPNGPTSTGSPLLVVRFQWPGSILRMNDPLRPLPRSTQPNHSTIRIVNR